MTLGDSPPRSVARRRARTQQEILAACWEVAAEDGLAGLSLGRVAAAVGMRAPSLYSYFDSKAAILDALFADGYEELDRRMAPVESQLPPGFDAAGELAWAFREFVGFAQENPARYQLMFTMAVPGWRPSAEAYAASQRSYGHVEAFVRSRGITTADDMDLYTAVSTGLAVQQMANDPHGDRWSRRSEEVMQMLLDHIGRRTTPATTLEDRWT